MKQYQTYLNRWIQFCTENSFNPTEENFQTVLLFLTFLFEHGLHYSAINTARSALSSLFGLNADSNRTGEHNLIRRFLGRVFVQRPSLPRYVTTWNPVVVLIYLRSLSPLHEISLKLLSHKCVMLLALLTIQRIDNICKILREDIRFVEDNCLNNFSQLVERSAPSRHQVPIELKSYPSDSDVCLVSSLREYITLSYSTAG